MELCYWGWGVVHFKVPVLPHLQLKPWAQEQPREEAGANEAHLRNIAI